MANRLPENVMTRIDRRNTKMYQKKNEKRNGQNAQADETVPTSLWDVQISREEGLGNFALRNIGLGTRLTQEAPLIKTSTKIKADSLIKLETALDLEKQEVFLDLISASSRIFALQI